MLEARIHVRFAHGGAAVASGHQAGAGVRGRNRGRRRDGGPAVNGPGHELSVQGLRAGVAGLEVLRGVDLSVRSGEVHAVMGPNGSGKSTLAHVLMGRPGLVVLGGTVTLDGADLLAMPTWRRARAGLFLAPQYPTEVPGVSLETVLEAATAPAATAPSPANR